MTRGRDAASMRFRLDPNAPEAPPPPPPRAAPPPPPRAAPVASPAAAPDAARTKRLLILAGLGLVVLAAGATAVLYATDTGPFAYPHAYMVEGKAVPSGASLPPAPQAMRDQFGVDSNPGRVPDDQLDSLAGGQAGSGRVPRPNEAWVESLRAGGADDAVVVIASKFASDKDAGDFVSAVGIGCARGGFTLLRDGDVVVLVIVGDAGGQAYGPRVASTILGQVSGIKRVCG